MNFVVNTTAINLIKTDCVVIGLYKDQQLTANGKLLDKISKGQLMRHVKREAMSGQLENTRWVHDLADVLAPNVLLAGLGEAGSPLTYAKYKSG